MIKFYFRKKFTEPIRHEAVWASELVSAIWSTEIYRVASWNQMPIRPSSTSPNHYTEWSNSSAIWSPRSSFFLTHRRNKDVPGHVKKTRRRDEAEHYSFLPSPVYGMNGQYHGPTALPLGKEPLVRFE